MKLKSELLRILAEQDDDARGDRSLEPEWLVAEAIFAYCHEAIGRGGQSILVGDLARQINQQLQNQGEGFTLGARKVGDILKNMGLRTERLGRIGRGLRSNSSLRRKIHQVAAQLGINRRNICSSAGLESGYGGAPCALCEEFRLTAGLRFVDFHESPPNRPPSHGGA